MVCPSCATPNSEESSTCQKCGKSLTRGFEIFPRLPINSGNLRPPAEPLCLLPFGVGGWLALLVIFIIVFCPIGFCHRAFSEVRLLKLGGFDPLGPALYRGIDALICLALAVWGVFTGWSLLDLSREARKAAEIYVAAVGGYSVLGYILVRMGTAASYLAYGGTAFTGAGALDSCLWMILWIAYLRKSKRVANTYGQVPKSAVA
jgi:hypothetical protein